MNIFLKKYAYIYQKAVLLISLRVLHNVNINSRDMKVLIKHVFFYVSHTH